MHPVHLGAEDLHYQQLDEGANQEQTAWKILATFSNSNWQLILPCDAEESFPAEEETCKEQDLENSHLDLKISAM
jgi:hypothetical protein